MEPRSARTPANHRTLVVPDLSYSQSLLSSWLCPVDSGCLIDYSLERIITISPWPVTVVLPQTAPIELIERLQSTGVDTVITRSRFIFNAAYEAATLLDLKALLVVTPIMGCKLTPDDLLQFVAGRFNTLSLDLIFTEDLGPDLQVCGLNVETLKKLCDFYMAGPIGIEMLLKSFASSRPVAHLRYEIVPVGQVFRARTECVQSAIRCRGADELVWLSGVLEAANRSRVDNWYDRLLLAARSSAGSIPLPLEGQVAPRENKALFRVLWTLDPSEEVYVDVMMRSIFTNLEAHGIETVVCCSSAVVCERLRKRDILSVCGGTASGGSVGYSVMRAARVIQLSRPEVVHCTERDWHIVGAAAKIVGVRVIIHIRDGTDVMLPAGRDRMLRELEGVADEIVVVSPACKAVAGRCGVSLDKIAVLSSMVCADFEPLRPSGGNELAVGAFGSFSNTREYWLLLRAFSLLARNISSNVRLFLYAEPEVTNSWVYEWVLADIERLGLEEQVTVRQGGIQEYLKTVDIVVATGHGIRNIRAVSLGVSAGRPVVVPANDVYSDLIEDEKTGLVYRDVGSLARALLRLCTDPAARLRLATSANEALVARFAASTVAHRWAEVYRRVFGDNAVLGR